LEIDDSSIVEELKKGSGSGCRLLVDKYQDFLYNWGLERYSNIDRQTLFELIDDTFLKVIENIASFEQKSKNAFRNWIFRILKNRIIDHMRAEKVKSGRLTFHSIDDDPPDNENGFNKIQIELNKIIYRDYLTPEPHEHPLANKVNEFIDTLDDNNKIILLGCAEGYSHREIAEWTGLPEGHIKVYYSRLKKKLEEQLTSELSIRETV